MKKFSSRSLLALFCVAVLLVGMMPAVMAANPVVVARTDGSWPSDIQIKDSYSAISVTYTFTNNTGSEITDLSAALVDGTVFTKGALSAATVANGGSATCTVTFSAGKGVGKYSDKLRFTYNGTAYEDSETFTVEVREEYAIDVKVTGADWQASDLLVGQDRTVTYTITNVGTKSINVQDITVDPNTAFSVNKTTATGSLAVDDSVTFTVGLPNTLSASQYDAELTVSCNHSVSWSKAISEKVNDKVTVKFYNGTTLLKTVEIASGKGVTYTGTTPTKTPWYGSYTFAGWTTTAATSNNTLSNTVQADVDLTTKTFNTDTNLYAVFAESYNAESSPISAIGSASVGSTLNALDTDTGYFSTVFSALSDLVKSKLGTTAAYLKFGETSGTACGQLYVSSAAVQTVGTTAKYFFTSSSYGDYDLKSVYFAPTGKTGTFKIRFVAYDIYGNNVSGILSVDVSGKGDISYTIDHKGTVALSATDFADFFYKKQGYTYTPSNVTFDTPYVAVNNTYGTLGAVYGKIYCNYGTTGQTDFTGTGSYLTSQSFYLTNSVAGNYAVSTLTYVPGTSTTDYTVIIPFTVKYSDSVKASGTMTVTVTDGHNVTYTVDHNGMVTVDGDDINATFRDSYPSLTLSYVYFKTPDKVLGTVYGNFYYNYTAGAVNNAYTTATLASTKFSYGTGTYLLDKLSFIPGTSGADYAVTVPFVAYAANGLDTVDGNLIITVTDTGDVSYTVAHNSYVTFSAGDFSAFVTKKNANLTLSNVKFGTPSHEFGTYYGSLYYNYGLNSTTALAGTGLTSKTFYASAVTTTGAYYLDSISFVPGTCTTDYSVCIPFTATATLGTQVQGTLMIRVGSGVAKCDIVYNTRGTTPVSICVSDIEDIVAKSYPKDTLSYITFKSVPDVGSLYYNYGGSSSYGSATAVLMKSSTVSSYQFYKNPTSAALYSMYDLSYVPYGSSYCTTIPFTAYTTGGASVSGTIGVCVTTGTSNDVYTVTTKNTAVALNSNTFATTVKTAGAGTMSYVKFLNLPQSTEGALYYDYKTTSTGKTAVTVGQKLYYTTTVSTDSVLSKVSFVPVTGFTGNVEIPFAVYNSADTLIYMGTLSIGVVNKIAGYSDVGSTEWYYKYIVELSDAGVINGYPNGSFKPGGNVTYGEALKLILVASGYGEQARTGAKDHWASGYLNKAVALGIYTSAEAKKVNLNAAITREEVARIAAAALKLAGSSISSPFADTKNASVLALYQAGIIEGSFNTSGLRYFYPSNNIKRSEVSAIIWRINGYTK